MPEPPLIPTAEEQELRSAKRVSRLSSQFWTIFGSAIATAITVLAGTSIHLWSDVQQLKSDRVYDRQIATEQRAEILIQLADQSKSLSGLRDLLIQIKNK